MHGRPIAMLRSLDDDSHVQTKVAQYQASTNERASLIVKSLIVAKLESQNVVLRKYGLKPHLEDFREKIERIKTKNYSDKDLRASRESELNDTMSRYSPFP